MNKKELLAKIDLLITESKIDEANVKTPTEKMFFIGKENGLIWAKIFIHELEEK